VKSLETVLADALERANLLRHEGHSAQASSIDRVVSEVRASMDAYLTVLSESEAQLQSGWSVERLRNRFPEWEARGLAMLDQKGKRRYRKIVVPIRAEQAAAKLAGLRGDSLRSANG
jgi:hypothetical protein